MPLPDSTPRHGLGLRSLVFAAVTLGFLLLIVVAVLGSYYIVAPNERAGVRQLGKVTTDKPIQPGVHFKMPFISNVDRALVSLTNLHIPKFTVTTVDNQLITLDINVS